jgi:hypothetical protein
MEEGIARTRLDPDDGEAWVDWDSPTSGPPQEIPLPDDLPV